MERAYRDAQGAVWARLRALENDVTDRESRVTPAFWSSLPAELSRRLGALRAEASPSRESLDALLAAQQSLEAYREALDAALERLPELETAWNALPDTAPLPDPGVKLVAGEGLTSGIVVAVSLLGERLRTVTRRHDRGAVVEPLGDVAYAARFAAAGTPLALVSAGVGTSWQPRRAVSARVAVATSIRRGTPAVAVRPEGLADGFARAFRLRRTVALGDPEFDAFFQVEGPTDAARAVLVPAVRAALLMIAREDVPSLVVGHGVATVSWSFEPTSDSVDAALRALTAIRATTTPPPLRREATAPRGR